MVVVRSSQAELQEVKHKDASGAFIAELITAREAAPNFAMRLFEILPGGHTMRHEHPWEHEVFVLQGEGEVHTADGPVPVQQGDAVLILPGELHAFVNTGSEPMRFLCMIPVEQPCCR